MSQAAPCPPVLVLAFNRPDTTLRVLESLRAVRPGQVFFAVDGPRPDRAGDTEAVAGVRALETVLDWGCEVRTLFRERNLGCKLAVSQAITWFLSGVDEGIILEDDCVADPSFFRFAGELLERYRDDERVAMVSGNNYQQGRSRTPYSYYYSRYTHIWGWATWRRAWRWYDHSMAAWPEARDGGWLADILGDRRAVRYWTRVFDDTHADRNTSWAYRWIYSAWMQSALTILPECNLVTNIGFDERATHTVRRLPAQAALQTTAMPFPLRHPPFVIRDARADAFTQRRVYVPPPLWRRALGRARRLLRP